MAGVKCDCAGRGPSYPTYRESPHLRDCPWWWIDYLGRRISALETRPLSDGAPLTLWEVSAAPSQARNEMLRELMAALDEPLTARPDTPEAVWREMLERVRELAGKDGSA
jgi:hypothetical protein